MISFPETQWGEKTKGIYYILGGLSASAAHSSDINELRSVLLKRPPGKQHNKDRCVCRCVCRCVSSANAWMCAIKQNTRGHQRQCLSFSKLCTFFPPWRLSCALFTSDYMFHLHIFIVICHSQIRKCVCMCVGDEGVRRIWGRRKWFVSDFKAAEKKRIWNRGHFLKLDSVPFGNITLTKMIIRNMHMRLSLNDELTLLFIFSFWLFVLN